MLDFFEFGRAEPCGLSAGVTPLFACSTANADGGGTVAITTDAVYLGGSDDVTRIEAVHIRSWSVAARGPVFALTVEGEEAHVAYLFVEFRSATVAAMTRVVGPEHVRLRAA